MNKNNSTILTQTLDYLNELKAEVPADIIGELRNREDVGYIGSLERPVVLSPYIPTDDALTEKPIVHFLPPKQQLKKGILPENITCKKGTELIFKSSDNSPACVKPETAEKLIERGWAVNDNAAERKPIIIPTSGDPPAVYGYSIFEISHYPKLNEIATKIVLQSSGGLMGQICLSGLPTFCYFSA